MKFIMKFIWILLFTIIFYPISIFAAGGSILSINITTTGGTGTIKADNTDLAFGSGSTTFPHWIEQSTAEGTASIWVKVPYIYPGDTQIQMFYNGDVQIGSFSTVFTKDYGETGLVGLWHLDERAGATATDSSGMGNHGTLVGANGLPVWQTTDGGYWDGHENTYFNTGSSLSFDGVDDYVNVPHTASISFERTDPITISCWIRWVGGYIALSKQPYRGAGYSISSWGSDVYWALSNNWPNNYNRCYVSNFPQNVWTFLAVTWPGGDSDAKGLRMYINGTLAPTTVDSNTLGNMSILNQEPFQFGGHIADADTSYMQGLIDEVRIYKRALSAEEIRALYERRKFTPATITVTYGAEQDNPKIIYPGLSKMRTVTINNSGTVTLTDFQVKIPIRIGPSGAFVKD